MGFIEADWKRTLERLDAMLAKTLEDTRRFADMVAAKQGWTVNPDAEFTATLLEGLTIELEPLRLLPLSLPGHRGQPGSGRRDVLCPCRYARDGRSRARPLLLRPLPPARFRGRGFGSPGHPGSPELG
ncbi:MAG: hypothetical protein MZV70_05755 [Desulfobacterales bacterium]|nr:hypothetical protein [Desulfobacterales bacterium]